ncbi:AN1-type zinc finger protein 5-like [Grus japonensis]|uniref:AN1-type zinc finger protein 5-like n=1 Tax=Grus japonensis TaxID=30415 RepID=A0ABC9YGA1_GRUJA
MMVKQRFHLHTVKDPMPEQVEAPEGGCDPVGSPHWSKLLAGPVEREAHTGAVEEGSDRAALVGTWHSATVNPPHVIEATEGEGESSQFAEVKAIQLALEIAE